MYWVLMQDDDGGGYDVMNEYVQKKFEVYIKKWATDIRGISCGSINQSINGMGSVLAYMYVMVGCVCILNQIYWLIIMVYISHMYVFSAYFVKTKWRRLISVDIAIWSISRGINCGSIDLANEMDSVLAYISMQWCWIMYISNQCILIDHHTVYICIQYLSMDSVLA